MYAGIWAISVSVHYCLFLHTCGINQHYSQNSGLATTSNDEPYQEENKRTLHSVEELHWGVHCHFSLVCEGAPYMIRCLGWVSDIPLIHWQGLAVITISAIGRLAIPPQIRVAIYRTLVFTSHCNPRCHPILIANKLATIDESSRLLTYYIKSIFLQESSVVPVFPQSTWDQQCLNAPSECKWEA